MNNERPKRYVITVLAEDRVGIIAEVSEVLYQLGGNLEALSQTVVWNWFTMIVCASFPERVHAEEIKAALEKSGDMAATVVPFKQQEIRLSSFGEQFVVAASGEDRPGIVRALTACFARNDINIEDVWNEVQEGRFFVIFHITIPEDVDPDEARSALEKAGQEVGVEVSLQHIDIFTATNSLALRSRGLKRNGHRIVVAEGDKT